MRGIAVVIVVVRYSCSGRSSGVIVDGVVCGDEGDGGVSSGWDVLAGLGRLVQLLLHPHPQLSM